MSLIKSRDQKEFSAKLENEINSFLINFKKRYNLFPWKTFNKVSSFKPVQNEVIKINGNKYTIKELSKRVNQINSKLKSMTKSSYFNYVINGFLKESNKQDQNKVKLIYNDYSSQLKLIFKEMKLDFEFCMTALSETNKIIKDITKDKESIKITYKESEDKTQMIGILVNESGEELDFRDFYLECYESAITDAPDTTKENIKEFKSSLKEDDFSAAKNAIKNIKSDLSSFKSELNEENANKVISKVNGMIKSIVSIVPNNAKTAEVISKLRDEKNKNDAIDDDMSASTIINQIKTSIDVLDDVCDAIEDDIIDKYEEFKKNGAKSVAEAAYNEKVLSVYTACKNGEITLEEREDILEMLNNERFISESCEVEDGLSKKEKFDRIVKELYERCRKGEFDIDQREVLINKAHDMIFNNDEIKEISPINTVKSNELADEDADSSINPEADNNLSANTLSNNLNTANNNLANAIKNISIKTE